MGQRRAAGNEIDVRILLALADNLVAGFIVFPAPGANQRQKVDLRDARAVKDEIHEVCLLGAEIVGLVVLPQIVDNVQHIDDDEKHIPPERQPQRATVRVKVGKTNGQEAALGEGS
jgi:hypothetical protein